MLALIWLSMMWRMLYFLYPLNRYGGILILMVALLIISPLWIMSINKENGKIAVKRLIFLKKECRIADIEHIVEWRGIFAIYIKSRRKSFVSFVLGRSKKAKEFEDLMAKHDLYTWEFAEFRAMRKRQRRAGNG